MDNPAQREVIPMSDPISTPPEPIEEPAAMPEVTPEAKWTTVPATSTQTVTTTPTADPNYTAVTSTSGVNVTVTPSGTLPKPWHQSKTIIFNGIFLVLSVYVASVDFLTGQNVLTGLMATIFPDPTIAAESVTLVTALATGINVILRLITSQPIQK
jgi:hypothetical protein